MPNRASSSVIPAEVHPGSSGQTADQLCASASYSRTTRNFMPTSISGSLEAGVERSLDTARKSACATSQRAADEIR